MPGVQHACMDAIRSDPAAYAAFSKLCAQHDITVSLAGGAAAPLALPAAPSSHPTDALAEEIAGPPPLRALLDAVGGALGAVGRDIAAYVDRLQTRLQRLVLRLRGIDPDGPAPDGGDDKGAAGPPAVEASLLMDVTVAATGLLVVVALLMRNGPLIAAVLRN